MQFLLYIFIYCIYLSTVVESAPWGLYRIKRLLILTLALFSSTVNTAILLMPIILLPGTPLTNFNIQISYVHVLIYFPVGKIAEKAVCRSVFLF